MENVFEIENEGKSLAVKVKNLFKTFGKVEALSGVDLEIEKGTIFGLLGPNGAGKTTLVRILTTLLKPSRGSAFVGGYDVEKKGSKVREIIGLTGQFAAIDDNLTGFENLELVGWLYHLPRDQVKKRANDLLSKFELIEAGSRLAKTYSGGMKRRLDLSLSLMGNPQILLLDEPTTGLDPRSRIELWEIIKNLVREGTTILLTTQYLEEADQLADKIAVIDKGKIIALGTSGELKSQVGGEVIELHVKEKDRAMEVSQAISPFGDSQAYVEEGSRIILPVSKGALALTNIIRRLDGSGVHIVDIVLRKPTLDEVFLKLTGHTTEN